MSNKHRQMISTKVAAWLMRRAHRRYKSALHSLYPDQEERVYALMSEAGQEAESLLFADGQTMKMAAIYPHDGGVYEVDIMTNDDDDVEDLLDLA